MTSSYFHTNIHIHKMFIPFVLLFLLITISLARAQDNNTKEGNPLEPGTNALQFQVTENFKLSSFTGSTISYKHQVTDRLAHRAGLSFGNTLRVRNFPDRPGDQNLKEQDLSLAASYTWQHYIDPGADIKFYYGSGPGISGWYARHDDTNGDRILVTKTWHYGLSGLAYAGVEWFFEHSMSIHAEYGASVNLSLQRQRTTGGPSGDPADKVNYTLFRIGGDGVRFGISVYF